MENRMLNIIQDYVDLRSKIKNKDNGYANIGCVAVSSNKKNHCLDIISIIFRIKHVVIIMIQYMQRLIVCKDLKNVIRLKK